jgi:hypothetical protein
MGWFFLNYAVTAIKRIGVHNTLALAPVTSLALVGLAPDFKHRPCANVSRVIQAEIRRRNEKH